MYGTFKGAFLVVRIMRRAWLLLGVLVLTAFLPTATGHVPVEPGENEALDHAFYIENPLKSWAIYGTLQQSPQYYRFDMQAGDLIYLGLLVPPFEAARSFTPSLVLMSPGEEGQGTVPLGVTVPPAYGAMVLEGQLAEKATYEPFGPGSFHWLAELRLPAPSSGTYYVAVVSSQEGGNYGLVVGTLEAFTLTEWIFNPFNMITVYQWEGQSLFLILAPAVVTAAVALVGAGVLLRRGGRLRDRNAWVGSLAGVLYLGSAATILYQMGWSLSTAALGADLAITLAFALLPLGLGLGILRLTLKGTGVQDSRGRVKLAILGVAGLFAWAGFLLGPALALVASFLPAVGKGRTLEVGPEEISRA